MVVAELPVRSARGACPHDCPDTCAWTVTVRDGVAVELRGDPDHPFTRGGLCAKVNHFLEDRVYQPDRLLHPLRRSGPKGSGSFEEVSWDEALDAIAERLTDIADGFGASAIMPYSYMGTQGLLQGNAMSDAFFSRLGATDLVRAVCGSTGLSGEAVTMGSGPGIVPEELARSRHIILWGTNTLSTNLHLWPFIREAKAAGATVVVIDPVKTRTAAAADRHVRPMPGTDGALALGMMRVIVDEGLHDRDYVERFTVGFDRLLERLDDYPIERVAEITGIDGGDIVDLATAYATTRPTAIRTLVGMEHRAHGAMTYRTIACLPALVGAWRERGGGLCHMTFQLFGELDWSCGIRVESARIDRSVNMVQLGRALTDGSMSPPILGLFVYNSNPAAIAPNQRLVLEGLAREDLFTVVAEHTLTDTAAMADYVLPATTQVEHFDLLWSWGQTYLTYNEPAISPVGEALPNSEIFRRLATRMGFRDPGFSMTDEEMMDAAMAPLGAERIAELRSRGWIRLDTEAHRLPYAEGGFATPSGSSEFFSEQMAASGFDPLPGFTPARESPAGDPELAARFPLSLTTAKGAHHFLNSSYGNVERALRAEKTPTLDIHPDDAGPRSIAEGDDVRVFNDRASVTLPARVGDRVRPGMVSMPSGWWASRSPSGLSANALTPDGLSDMGGGGDFHDALVQVEASGRSDGSG